MGHRTRKKLSKKPQQGNNFVALYDFTYTAIDSLISTLTPKVKGDKKYYPIYGKK
jgi:hypothetical protein